MSGSAQGWRRGERKEGKRTMRCASFRKPSIALRVTGFRVVGTLCCRSSSLNPMVMSMASNSVRAGPVVGGLHWEEKCREGY